ncbi:MAG: flagellar hook-basal body protein [Bacillota bacterium]
MRGLYNAAGSMLVNQVRLENISNNLSNIHTNGYKRSEVIARTFPEIYLYRLEKGAPHAKTRLHGPIGIAAENVAVAETVVIHRPGTLRETGRELDLALPDAGFFVVETPAGLRYTRDGHFHLSADGILVNAGGHPVWGERGPAVLQTDRPLIDRQGNIYVDGELVERLQVLAFAPQDLIWKEGYNLYEAAPDALPEVLEHPSVFQGYLEEANSDLGRQMTEMLRVRRSYEAAQKISQVYDRLLSRAANELAGL